MMWLLKHKPYRLKGKKLNFLYIEALERDKYTCRGCGRHTKQSPHHIIYRSQNGDDVLENLITLCKLCHVEAHQTKNKNIMSCLSDEQIRYVKRKEKENHIL